MNIELRFPKREDEKEIAAFLKRNKEHLLPWETIPNAPLSDLLTGWLLDMDEGRSVRFFLFDKERLIGMINFTQIFRGAFQACYLGYKIDKDYEGKGLMFKSLKKALEHMFEKEKIHRIMSNFLPRNKRSGSLLLRLGFAVEGYAPNYLKINGVWEDHILTALSYERWLSNEPSSIKETINSLNKWEETL